MDAIKALSDLVEAITTYEVDHRTEGCPNPECVICTASRMAQEKLDIATDNARTALLAAKQNGWSKWPDTWPDESERKYFVIAQGVGSLIPDVAIFTSTNAVTGESDRHWFGWRDEEILYWMPFTKPLPPLPEGEGK